MNRPRISLYARLLLGFSVATLLALVLGGYLAGRYIDYSTATEIDWVALAQQADDAYERGGVTSLSRWAEQQRRQGIEATLFEHGRPLAPIRLGRRLEAHLPEWLDDERDFVMQQRHGLTVAVSEITGAHGTPRQLVAVSRDRMRLPPQARARILFAMQLGLSLLFVGLVGWWLARSVARPVAALRAATQRMTAGDLSARVGRRRGLARDELAQLASDFDAMAERIEALVAHERGVLQDLSHELRSPLARLQLLLDLGSGSAEPARAEGYFEQAEQEIARLDRLLDNLLALSRLEGGLPGDSRQPLGFAELVRECVARAQLVADAHEIILQLAPADAAVRVATISAHAPLLEAAVDNLLDNAIKFSPPGGRVELATTMIDTGAIELHLRDHGPGIPEADMALLFRPFFRGSNAARAEGHGLGLAFVQRVVKAHGGTLALANAPDGGLDVHLRLPLA